MLSSRATSSDAELIAAVRAGDTEAYGDLFDRHREAALRGNLADLLHDAGHPEDAMGELKRAVAVFAEVAADEEPQPEIWKLVAW